MEIEDFNCVYSLYVSFLASQSTSMRQVRCIIMILEAINEGQKQN